MQINYFGTGIKGNITTRDYEISVANGDDFDLKGFFVANGQALTPSCLDKVPRSEVVSGIARGSDDSILPQHNHVASQVSHNHKLLCHGGSGTSSIRNTVGAASPGWFDGYIDSKTPTITVDNEGVSPTDKNIPACISSIPIIRMS